MVNGSNLWEFAFYFIPQIFRLVRLFFESMSGITTTGATVITDLDGTSKKVFFYGEH